MKEICNIIQQLELRVSIDEIVNYIRVFNDNPVCHSLSVTNFGSKAISNITIAIEGYYFPRTELFIEKISPGVTEYLDTSRILPSIDRLRSLSDAVFTEVSVSVSSRTRELGSFRIPITIEAWNQWHCTPEDTPSVASFVMPHHDYVAEILSKAGDILSKSHPDLALSGYSSTEMPDHSELHNVIFQAEAIWQAIVDQHLRYITLCSDFINEGQKIMTVDIIRRFRQGNCLDLSLLFCSCLERINLSAALVFVPGHVMPAVWLSSTPDIDDPVISPDVADPSVFLSRRDEKSLYVFESTLVPSGLSLTEAHEAASLTAKSAGVEFILDLTASRRQGYKPLPFAGDISNMPAPENNEITGCQDNVGSSSRRDGWERKLLDLTMRNPMLNLRPGKNILPLWETDVPRIISLLKANRLSEIVGKRDEDNTDALKNLYRASRTSLEENGANSLFVAVGTLRWYDKDDTTPHIAPLLFIPATIVRKKALTYEIRLRDDDPLANVTLIEMLRQMFGVTFPELDTLPMDADGFPDWPRILSIFSTHVEEINRHQPADRLWELPVESYVGIFSFTKYLMWNDIHNHPAVLDAHPVLHGMMQGYYSAVDSSIDPRLLEANHIGKYMLPIDYDSSQLMAVAEAHEGNSFVLHGPPGTGKSQTITNIIADSLYAGKRVLFVAEKKAALDVVQNRLESIGLSPYCLELHSNKTDKRSFFAQLAEACKEGSLGSGECRPIPAEYDSAIDSLRTMRDTLDNVTEAIHAARNHDLSLYDCICASLTRRYDDLTMRYENISSLSPSQIRMLAEEMASLDIVERILGIHPSESGLLGLYPMKNTAENQEQLTLTISQLPETFSAARKKAQGWFNRWFRHRTPMQILESSPLWQQFKELASTPDEYVCDIDKAQASVEKWRNAIDKLRNWYHFSQKYHKINSYSLPSVLSHYLKGNSGAETARATESAYYRTIARHIIDNDSRLRSFNGAMHSMDQSAYLRQVDSVTSLRRKTLIASLSNHQRTASLSVTEQKQLAQLSRRMLNNGRAVALRKIITEAGDVLHKIFPCMLMSPLSVAQYLEMRPGMFDIVIFDEASQMETPDAIGAIARGGSIVVTGDPMQLPPTRFFTARTGGGEEVEESEDADSILEDCIALGLPSRYLSRHYRSRHESLISFSNQNFYDNRLLTFPSHNDAERKVSLIDPKGVYDYGRSRTNRIEAEAVVKHIISLVSNREEDIPSIGVVAFSKAQSNLIEDILNQRLAKSRLLQQKLDQAKEPIFIKNLENVQGDERDIIIFSIGYGPDKDGNVSLNFGPLNQAGGERRLNVAVSRAREEMIIFSSLQARHIPQEGILAKGVQALRKFLAFAAGTTEISETVDSNVVSETIRETVIEDIACALRQKGKEVRTHVGRSSFKIDIAIVDPQNPDRYESGIIIDGRDYHNLPTVRDREVTVPAMLRSLGWRLHRIWVIDWLEHGPSLLSTL